MVAITYLKAAHDNTPEEDQGNPAKWAWNLFDWSGENTTIIVGGQMDSDGNITGYAGFTYPSTGGGIVAGYNTDHGWGAGSTDASGSTSFYYPSINYNAAEENTAKSISIYMQAEANFQNFRDEYWARRTSFEVGRLIYTGWAQEGWNFDGTKDDTWYNRSEALINIYPEAWFFGGLKFGFAARGSKGLMTPNKFFGSVSEKQATRLLTKKYGKPVFQNQFKKSFYNPRTRRSFTIHNEPGHGLPHVDINTRGWPKILNPRSQPWNHQKFNLKY